MVVDNVVKTDSKGKANLDLDLKKGKYNVTVKYGGNENYTGKNTTQKLTIKEKVVEAKHSSSSSTSSNTPRYTTDEYGTYDNELDMYIDRQAKGLSKMNYNIILILKGVMVVEQINLMFDRG